jgi:phosphohistidine phosphatase
MKTLQILRHAKSSRDDPTISDHDRPLQKRGKKDAPRIGELLFEARRVPDLILSSTAKRARKTAAKVAQRCQYQGVIQLSGELYLATPQTCLRVLHDVSDEYQRVMLVGHNPGLEELASLLTGQPITLPTAALAEVALEIDSWPELSAGRCGTLVRLWSPREPEPPGAPN